MKNTPKKLTKVQELERKNSILESALYQGYNDGDDALGALYLIIEESKKSDCNMYQLRRALECLRTALIANQSLMMDCAGLEY